MWAAAAPPHRRERRTPLAVSERLPAPGHDFRPAHPCQRLTALAAQVGARSRPSQPESGQQGLFCPALEACASGRGARSRRRRRSYRWLWRASWRTSRASGPRHATQRRRTAAPHRCVAPLGSSARGRAPQTPHSARAQRTDCAGSSSGSCYTSDEESIRVHDLVPPVTRRAEYEVEWKVKPPLVDQGFEVINWGAWPDPIVSRADLAE